MRMTSYNLGLAANALIPYWSITFKKIPVYMQAVEHRAKLITEAPEKNCGTQSRDVFILYCPDHPCLKLGLKLFNLLLQLHPCLKPSKNQSSKCLRLQNREQY